MIEGWSDWRTHDGLAVPVAPGTWCQVVLRSGHVLEDTSHGPLGPDGMSQWIWSHLPAEFWGYGIERYRVRQFRAEAELRRIVECPASREVVPA